MKLIFLALIFAAQLASAHPLLSDPVISIPAGATMSILKPLNIPPKLGSIQVRQGERLDPATVNPADLYFKYCTIDMKAKKSFDRVLAPRTMRILKIHNGLDDAAMALGYYITVADPTVYGIWCSVQGFDNIGTFLKGFEDIGGFQISFPAPVRVKFESPSSSSQFELSRDI